MLLLLLFTFYDTVFLILLLVFLLFFSILEYIAFNKEALDLYFENMF